MTTQADYEAELVTVRAAIARVYQGQSYRIGDRQMTRANLPDLQAREQWLLTRISRLQRGGVRISRGTIT